MASLVANRPTYHILLGLLDCLNTETFQKDILADRSVFKSQIICIVMEMGFAANPIVRWMTQFSPHYHLVSRVKIKKFRWHNDRVCILGEEGLPLLFYISCLDAYMKEFCRLESEGKLRGYPALNVETIILSHRRLYPNYTDQVDNQ